MELYSRTPKKYHVIACIQKGPQKDTTNETNTRAQCANDPWSPLNLDSRYQLNKQDTTNRTDTTAHCANDTWSPRNLSYELTTS